MVQQTTRAIDITTACVCGTIHIANNKSHEIHYLVKLRYRVN